MVTLFMGAKGNDGDWKWKILTGANGGKEGNEDFNRRKRRKRRKGDFYSGNEKNEVGRSLFEAVA